MSDAVAVEYRGGRNREAGPCTRMTRSAALCRSAGKTRTAARGSAAPVRRLDQQTYSRHLMPAGTAGDERQLRRSRHCARSTSSVCCTFGSVVGDTVFLMSERPEVAGTTRSRSSLTPAVGHPGNHAEVPLPGAREAGRSRPFAVLRAWYQEQSFGDALDRVSARSSCRAA